MRGCHVWVAALFLAFVASGRGSALAPQGTGRVEILAPATFAGEIPCADCSGIRLALTLRSDGVFLLRQTYLGAASGKDASFVDLGRWGTSDDGRKIVLRGGTEAPRQFAIVSVGDAAKLRMLNNLGGEIRSGLNYELARTAAVDPFPDTFRVRGMYVYFADAGILTECLSGLRLPVAQESDNAALERAYLQARKDVGQPILVTFEGHLARRPRMEGEGTEEVIVVDRFDRARPGESCSAPSEGPKLENTTSVAEPR